MQDLTPPANFHNTFQEFPRPKALLAFLEGTHDIACFQRFSQLLHTVDATYPDLQDWEGNGRIVFLPVGGSHLKSWAHRLQSLGHKEFHLYDREDPVIAADRARIVAAINRRPGCYAVLTQKRALENYLHPTVVSRVLGIDAPFGDQDDVPETLAKAWLRQAGGPAWEELTPRGRKRLKDRSKLRLNREAVAQMTYELLRERDPHEEVLGWYKAITRLVTEE